MALTNQITWTDKIISPGTDPEGKWKTVDSQEVKDKHNATDQFLADLAGFVVGYAYVSADVSVSSDGVTVTLSLEANGGGDLKFIFTDGVHEHDCTPADTVTLTAGSDTSPTMNYVYIRQADKLLTVSTVGWPSEEYAAIATVFVQSAASLQTDGAMKCHAWTDHLKNDYTGHAAHVNYWIRNQPATWLTGALVTPTGGASTLDVAVAAGTMLQLHPHSSAAYDTATGSDIYIVNDPTTPNNKKGDLTGLTEDANGDPLGGGSSDHYNLVIWQSVSEDAGDGKLFCNLPSGSYANNSGDVAVLDSNRTAVYTIPTDYRGTGILLARLTIQVNGSTYTVLNNEDLRGLFPSTAAGGTGGGGGSEFLDNAFKIQNFSDDTKVLAFDVDPVATATTVTVKAPTADADMSKLINGVKLVGAWDASSGTFPGSASTLLGDGWIVSVAGTTGGVYFEVGDLAIARVDNPSTIAYTANWLQLRGKDTGRFSSSLFKLLDSGDITKRLLFNLASISTGTDRTWTAPNEDLNFGAFPSKNITATTRTITGTSDTITAADNNKILYCTNAALVTLTHTVASPTGFSCVVISEGAGGVAIATGATYKVDSIEFSPDTNYDLPAQGVCSVLGSTTANTIKVIGDV